VIKKLFQKRGNHWIKTVAAIFLWMMATAYLIHFYGPEWHYALVDSAIHTILILGGFVLLENIFKFYLPHQSSSLFGLDFTIILTVLILYAGDYILLFLYKDQTEYLLFLDSAFLIRGFVLLVIFSSFTVLLIFYGRLEDQLKTLQRNEMIEKMAKEAELYHLRQQLQPHFLFNSLNSVNALIHRSPEKAREMVLQLSGFLRGTIQKDDKKWISVREEAEHLQLFLNIERVRFGHRLMVNFNIEEEAKELQIPLLLMQPLLENAVKHGLYGVVGEVIITLELRMAGNNLEVTLSNPFDPSEGQAEGMGFGLETVKRRLYLLFGRYDLISSSFQENLFIVSLKIPQLYDQDLNH